MSRRNRQQTPDRAVNAATVNPTTHDVAPRAISIFYTLMIVGDRRPDGVWCVYDIKSLLFQFNWSKCTMEA